MGPPYDAAAASDDDSADDDHCKPSAAAAGDVDGRDLERVFPGYTQPARR